MRTTVRIEDDLLLQLKDKAVRESSSLTRVFNQTLRAGLRAEHDTKKPRRRYHEKTHSLGVPRVDLTKALSLSTQLEDDETLRKVQLRK
ncbi:MAG: hypothetical protein WBO69_08825 [Thermoanaerobaculia bacterium]|jgi:hypothetical protein